MKIYRNNVKSFVGWLILVGHVTIILYIFIGKSAVWNFDQQLTVALTVSPVTAVYFSAVVKNFVENSAVAGPGDPVNLNYAGVSLLLPAALILLVIYMIHSYPSEKLNDVDTLQKVVAGAETMLGGGRRLCGRQSFSEEQRGAIV